MTTEQHIPAGLIGARVRRKEDPRLLTGRAQFVDDIVLPGMLESALRIDPQPRMRPAEQTVQAPEGECVATAMTGRAVPTCSRPARRRVAVRGSDGAVHRVHARCLRHGRRHRVIEA